MDKIKLINGSAERVIDFVMDARLREALDTEYTLSFTLMGEDAGQVSDATAVQIAGQQFDIISYHLDTEGVLPTASVECEHVSYRLNDEQYDLDNFVFSGTPSDALAQLLTGTPFTVGIVEPTASISVSLAGGSRRAILLSVAALCNAEISFYGMSIGFVTHRGSSATVNLLDTDNVEHISVSRDKREDLTAYNVSLGRMTTLALGDEIHIGYTPLAISADTRIIALEYNPYDTCQVEIEVGEYIPDILDRYIAQRRTITATAQTAQSAFATATTAFTIADTANTTAQTAKATADICVKTSELNASIDTYINSTTGTASIVSVCSGSFQAKGDYVTPTTLTSAVQQEVNSKFATLTLTTSVSTVAGETKSEIQLKSDATSLGSTITISATTKAQAQSAANDIVNSITLTTSTSVAGNETTSTLTLKNGTTTITSSTVKGTTATQAATIAADAVNGIMLSVSTSASGNETTSTLTLKNGTTTITSSTVKGTTAAQAATIAADAVNGITLSTSTTASGNETTSTLTLKSGTTTITSSTVKGTTATQAATIATSAVNGITLSVTNGASSSTLTLKNGSTTITSGTIQFTGVVTFTDLSTASTSTIINGANIRTGTISADRIDVDSIKTRVVYGSGLASDKIMITSNNKEVHIGGSTTDADFQRVFLRADNEIRISSRLYSGYGIAFDTSSMHIVMKPINDGHCDIGDQYYRFRYMYIENISVGTGNTYSLIMDSSVREVRPASTSDYNNWSIGTRSYPIKSVICKYAVIGGSGSDAQIAFFGGGYISKQTLITTSNNMSYSAADSSNYLYIINNLVGILKKYGLINA